jgi:membrane protease YdiL (CAAX protease family)
LIWLKLGILSACLVLGFIGKTLKPLQYYFLFLGAFLILWWGMGWIRKTPSWTTWESTTSWVSGMAGIQALKLGIALVLAAGLFIIFQIRTKFYCCRGDFNTNAAPVRWLGMRNPIPWKKFGTIIALAAFFSGIAFLWLTNHPTGAMIVKALPILPFVILISATNGLSEEVMFRSALLAPLQMGIHPSPALWMTSLFFGLAHYSGTFPSGLSWVFLTGFLGYLFGKSMLETRGIVMSWFLHFISDVPVLFFTAVYTIQ